MCSYFTEKIIIALTDWTLALLGSSLIIWIVVTQPVVSSAQTNTPVNVDTLKLQQQLWSLNHYQYEAENIDENVSLSAYISKQLDPLGELEYQNLPGLISNHKNLILNIGNDSEEVLVIGTHYDDEGWAATENHNMKSLTTFIELAHQLSLQAESLSNRVILVAYTRPKTGLGLSESAGSDYHALSLKKSGKKVKLMIALDNIDSFESAYRDNSYFCNSSQNKSESYFSLNGRLFDFINIKNFKESFTSVSAIPLYSQNLPASFNNSEGGAHKSYWLQGFPAVLINSVQVNKSADLSENSFTTVNVAQLVKGLFQVVLDSTILIQNNDLLALKKREEPPDLY